MRFLVRIAVPALISLATAAAPLAPGDSLQAAIDAAPDGAVIELERGLYVGSVVIERPLTLCGAGDATIVQGDRVGSALIVRGDGVRVRIENLTVTNGRGWNGHGIETQGSPVVDLTGVTARDNAWAGVWATDRSELHMEECRIIDNRTHGLYTWDFSRVSLQSCEIAENATHGILAFHLSEIWLADCDVHNNLSGVWAWDGSRIHGAKTRIVDNTLNGLAVQNGALLDLSTCDVSGNGQVGVWISDSGRAVLAGCFIRANGAEGVFLERDGIGEFTGNLIAENHGIGIRASTATCQGEFDPGSPYKGWVEGTANRVPGPGEPNANEGGSLCPAYPGSIWPGGFLSAPSPSGELHGRVGSCSHTSSSDVADSLQHAPAY